MDSTATFIKTLSDVVPGGVTYRAEQLVLRYLVDSRACPLCRAHPGFLCRTFGSQSLRSTHLIRLDVPPAELPLIVEWAVLEDQRRRSSGE